MKQKLKELKAETFDLMVRRDALKHKFQKLNTFINENIESIIILKRQLETQNK